MIASAGGRHLPGVAWKRDEGFETADNSRWSRKTLRPSSKFSPSWGLSDGIGPAPGPERIRIGGDGHSLHGSLESVPGFWAFVRRGSAYERYGGADFNIIL